MAHRLLHLHAAVPGETRARSVAASNSRITCCALLKQIKPLLFSIPLPIIITIVIINKLLLITLALRPIMHTPSLHYHMALSPPPPVPPLFPQDEDITLSLPELLSTGRGIATLVAEVTALAAMFPFIVVELGSLQAYAGGWLSLWNLLDVLTYSLQVWRSSSHTCG